MNSNRRPFIWKLIISSLVFAAALFALRGLEHPQTITGAVFALAVTLWITEALPFAVTALLCTTLLVILGAASSEDAFGAYGDPIIMLFIGSFILVKSMSESGLDERISLTVLRYEWATRTPARLLFTLGLIACVLSLFVSRTAVTAMMLPIGVGILNSLKKSGDTKLYSIGTMLMLTWGSSIAVGVLVGTPPNLIAAREIELSGGKPIGFVEWMTFAMPINAVMLFVAFAVLWIMYGRRAPATHGASQEASEKLAALGSMTQSQRNTVIAFFTMLALWLLPETSSMILGPESEFASWIGDRLSPPIAAVIGATLLFMLPAREGVEGRTITWKQAATIDWGTILLFGGGIALGSAMLNTGLAGEFGAWVASTSGVDSVWGITAICIFMAVLMSELSSNTASATTMVPIAIGLAQGADVSQIPPALGAGLGASFGFMLPVSTPPNAIVYSSGLVSLGQMAKAGLVLDICGSAVIWVCLRLLLPPLGLA